MDIYREYSTITLSNSDGICPTLNQDAENYNLLISFTSTVKTIFKKKFVTLPTVFNITKADLFVSVETQFVVQQK